MEQSPLIAQGLPIALFVIMIGMGLTLTPTDFAREMRNPRSMILGSALQLVLMPLAGLLLAGLPGMTAGLAVGLVIMAACPGGTTSNLIAYLGRGNVALSIVLTVTANLITIFTLPVWVNLALNMFDGESVAPVRLPFVRTVVMLSVITVIPVAIGMAVRAYNAYWASRAERIVGLFGAWVLVVLVVALAVTNRENLMALLVHAGPACALLNVVGFGFGFGIGRLLGLDWPDCITVSAELGIKNGTVGLLVALSLLENSEMAIPAAQYSVMMYGFGAILIAYGRRKVPAIPPPIP